MTPRLSILVANFQGETIIERCLDALLSQHCDFQFEVIVHDDASTDASCQIIRDKYPQVTLLTTALNCGFCESNNRLAEAARGEYLLLLNNDTRLHPGSLQLLSDHAAAHSGAGVISLPQYDMTSGELLDRGMFLDLFANPVPNLDEGSRQVATVMGSCLWISRGLWHQVGGLPEWFGSMAEDMYLCSRVRLLGLTVEVTEQGGYDHVVGHSFGGGKVAESRLNTSYKRRRLSELNKNRVIATCYPVPANVLVLFLQFWLLLTEGLLLSVVKRSTRPFLEIYLPSVTGILSDLGRLRRVQKDCAASRHTSIAAFFSPIVFRHHKMTLLKRHGIPSIR